LAGVVRRVIGRLLIACVGRVLRVADLQIVVHLGDAGTRAAMDSANSLEAALETVPESVTSLWMVPR